MLVEKRHLVLSGPWSRQVHPWSSLVYSQNSSCSVTNRIYDNPCTVEKLHPILLGPEQVQLQTSSCSVTNRIFLNNPCAAAGPFRAGGHVLLGPRPARFCWQRRAINPASHSGGVLCRRCGSTTAAQLRPARRATTAAIDLLYCTVSI